MLHDRDQRRRQNVQLSVGHGVRHAGRDGREREGDAEARGVGRGGVKTTYLLLCWFAVYFVPSPRRRLFQAVGPPTKGHVSALQSI